jgi:hypothetical protein
MNYVKIFSFAAVAVAALMASIAGNASADVICTTTAEPCNSEITKLEMSMTGSLSLKDTSNNEFATCTVGSFGADITAQGNEENPSGPITSLTWGKSGAGCNTTVDTVVNGRLELKTEGGIPEIWGKETEFTLVAFGVSCTYGFGTGTTLGRFTTGTPGKLDLNAVLNKTAGSFLCPPTARWSGSWTITNHSSVFVANKAEGPSGDIICTTNTDPCGTPITSLEGSISAGTSASLKDTSNNEFATCTVGSFGADITAQGNEENPSGPITSLTWGKSGAGCNTTVDTVVNGRLELKTEGGIPEIWGKETEFTLVAFGVSCTYGFGTGTTLGRFTTGTPGKLDLNAVLNKTAGSFLCPPTASWSGSWTITNHSSVFVANE